MCDYVAPLHRGRSTLSSEDVSDSTIADEGDLSIYRSVLIASVCQIVYGISCKGSVDLLIVHVESVVRDLLIY